MHHTSTDYHLRRLSQNAATLADELRAERDGVTAGSDERPALIAKLRARITEDYRLIFPQESA